MERPNYYAIIPAEVRYSDIKPNAKLLFGEITALTNKRGFCFATNNYFAELYQVSKNTISLWIGELKKGGFVSVEIIYENKQVKERRISITINRVGYSGKQLYPITKKGEDNNTRDNTTRLLSNRKKEFEEEVFSTNVKTELCSEFVDYWTEQNHSKTKMKFELERTFDIKRRLARWEKNSEKWGVPQQKKSRVQTLITTHKSAREMMDNINNQDDR